LLLRLLLEENKVWM